VKNEKLDEGRGHNGAIVSDTVLRAFVSGGILQEVAAMAEDNTPARSSLSLFFAIVIYHRHRPGWNVLLRQK